jgi:hypothetical protein
MSFMTWKEASEVLRNARCIICGTSTDHVRQPTYEHRTTGERFTITPEPVWVCDGCTYDAANAMGRYVDERTGPRG